MKIFLSHSLCATVHDEIWKYAHSGKISHANLDFFVQWNTYRIALHSFPFLSRYPMTWMAFVKGTVMCFLWIWLSLCRAVNCKCVSPYPMWDVVLVKFSILKQICGIWVVSISFLWAVGSGLSVDSLISQNSSWVVEMRCDLHDQVYTCQASTILYCSVFWFFQFLELLPSNSSSFRLCYLNCHKS